jgi:pimeloyl-ACP methyl ester carboxylesterase
VPLTESPSEGRLVDIGDTRLFVVEKSEQGYPLLCVHAAGRDHWSFGDYLDGLAPDVKVVLPDLRGHGMSDPASGLTLEQLAADIGALADALGLERYALLAHGDGARFAVRHALDAPERVTHLVLVAPLADVSAARPAGEYERRTAPAVERLELADELRAARAPDGEVAAPALVVDDSAYPFVEQQDAFVAGLRRFVTASG